MRIFIMNIAPRDPRSNDSSGTRTWPLRRRDARYRVRARLRAVTSHCPRTLPSLTTHAWEYSPEVELMWVGIVSATSPGRYQMARTVDPCQVLSLSYDDVEAVALQS